MLQERLVPRKNNEQTSSTNVTCFKLSTTKTEQPAEPVQK